MSCLPDGEDESKALLFDWLVVTFSPNQDSAEIIDGLLGILIIFLSERAPKEWSMAFK